jgi:hypothetical protein
MLFALVQSTTRVHRFISESVWVCGGKQLKSVVWLSVLAFKSHCQVSEPSCALTMMFRYQIMNSNTVVSQFTAMSQHIRRRSVHEVFVKWVYLIRFPSGSSEVEGGGGVQLT